MGLFGPSVSEVNSAFLSLQSSIHRSLGYATSRVPRELCVGLSELRVQEVYKAWARENDADLTKINSRRGAVLGSSLSKREVKELIALADAMKADLTRRLLELQTKVK